MKEKNLKRKLELKKRRQKILVKKALHKDISQFLGLYHSLQIQRCVQYVQQLLMEGFPGFNDMRSKNLLGHFDEAYRELREKRVIHFYHVRPTHYNEDDLVSMKETETERERRKLTTESESLMNRLIELSFDLDYDE